MHQPMPNIGEYMYIINKQAQVLLEAGKFQTLVNIMTMMELNHKKFALKSKNMKMKLSEF